RLHADARLRRTDPALGPLGDRRLRPRAAARAERVARRRSRRPTELDPMTALSKSLHPDEKIKAGKLGSNLAKAGAAMAVFFLVLSVVLVLFGSDDKTAIDAGHFSVDKEGHVIA